MQVHITLSKLNLLFSFTCFFLSFNVFAITGGPCEYIEEQVLVQIISKNQTTNDYTLSTESRKKRIPSNSPERIFNVPEHRIDKDLIKENYLLATIEKISSGTCTPLYVKNIEKFRLGELQIQVDEKLYYGGAFRLNEVQNCLKNQLPQCDTLQLPSYNLDEREVINSINPKTIAACSLSTIREYMPQLEILSSTNYVLGCFTKKKSYVKAKTTDNNDPIHTLDDKEYLVYFEKDNGLLVFRGVIF